MSLKQSMNQKQFCCQRDGHCNYWGERVTDNFSDGWEFGEKRNIMCIT